MKFMTVVMFTIFWALAPSSTGAALELTDLTVFACDEKGAVDTAGRWNTGPIDAAWDLFLHEGAVPWLNDKASHSIKVPLNPGSRAFTFHFDSTTVFPILGMNLFFDGRKDKPSISVFARTTLSGAAAAPFAANRAASTMGPPIAEVPASGSLSFDQGGPTSGFTSGRRRSSRSRWPASRSRGRPAPPARTWSAPTTSARAAAPTSSDSSPC